MCAETWASCLCQCGRAAGCSVPLCLSCCWLCWGRVKWHCPTAQQAMEMLASKRRTVKSANMSNSRPENPTSSVLTEGQKRKRGRPKKQPQEDTVEARAEKKPRGRPKGSKKMTAVTGKTVEPSAGKRQRGRPPKWPQAVVQAGACEEESSQGSSDSDLNLAPATQGITGKDGSRSGKTAGLKRSLSTSSATAE